MIKLKIVSGIDFNIYRNGTKITVPLWYELIMKALNSDQHANTFGNVDPGMS